MPPNCSDTIPFLNEGSNNAIKLDPIPPAPIICICTPFSFILMHRSYSFTQPNINQTIKIVEIMNQDTFQSIWESTN